MILIILPIMLARVNNIWNIDASMMLDGFCASVALFLKLWWHNVHKSR